MAWRRKASIDRDLGDRAVGVRELSARAIDAALAEVLTRRAAVELPERAREMHRVHPTPLRERVETRHASGLVVEYLAHQTQPARRWMPNADLELSGGRCDQLEGETFDREPCGSIPDTKLPLNPASHHDQGWSRRHARAAEHRTRDSVVRYPAGGGANQHTLGTVAAVAVLVRLGSWANEEALAPKLEPAPSHVLGKASPQHDRRARVLVRVAGQVLVRSVRRSRDREVAGVDALECRA